MKINLDITKIYIKSIKNEKDNNIEIFSSILKNYINKLQSECDNFTPKIMIKNFKKTILEFENLDKSIQSSVMFNKNNIITLNINSFNDLYHELLHMSSLNIGLINKYLVPFNEGYTQLLTERYFKQKSGVLYPFEVLFLKNIELIIGKDILEKKYFEGKFFDSLGELIKYCDNEKMSELVRDMHKIYVIEQTNDYENNYDNFLSALNNIFNILSLCIINKLDSISTNDEKENILLNCNYPSVIEIANFKFNIENNFDRNNYLSKIKEKQKIKEINQ